MPRRSVAEQHFREATQVQAYVLVNWKIASRLLGHSISRSAKRLAEPS